MGVNTQMVFGATGVHGIGTDCGMGSEGGSGLSPLEPPEVVNDLGRAGKGELESERNRKSPMPWKQGDERR